jgi:uncharacterized protein
MMLELNKSLFQPITQLELILTEGCNLGCNYCFEKNMLGYKKMPLEIAKRAIDILFDYSQNESELKITHFGGEPTLNFPAIQYATEYAEKKGLDTGKNIEFNMTSNGVLITEKMADYFVQHKIMVLLSIDGLKSSHDRFRTDKFGNGTFEQVMKCMNILKKRQKWIGTKMTIMPQNAYDLFNDVKGLYDLGVNQFIIGYATGIKWPEKYIRIYSEQLGKVYDWYKDRTHSDLRIEDFDNPENEVYFGCQAGRTNITVAVNGDISPCAKILALNNKQILVQLGNIQYGLTHLKNRSELVRCTKLRLACEEQGIAHEFQGGCFASNYEDNGDLFQPNLQDHTFSLLKRQKCAGCNHSKDM